MPMTLPRGPFRAAPARSWRTGPPDSGRPCESAQPGMCVRHSQGVRVHARLIQASSFGAVAVAYDEHRPDYAPPAVRWALEATPGARVLDLGAGTGKLTGTLVALGAAPIAVEPDPAMLTVLRRAWPALRALSGSAEAIPLPDASVDAV